MVNVINIEFDCICERIHFWYAIVYSPRYHMPRRVSYFYFFFLLFFVSKHRTILTRSVFHSDTFSCTRVESTFKNKWCFNFFWLFIINVARTIRRFWSERKWNSSSLWYSEPTCRNTLLHNIFFSSLYVYIFQINLVSLSKTTKLLWPTFCCWKKKDWMWYFLGEIEKNKNKADVRHNLHKFHTNLYHRLIADH